MRLVDNDVAEQNILEELIEAAKPVVPEAARRLHWLLATPFRYRPWGSGSRFRGMHDPGVLYGAIERRTACAEAGYWRWRFVRDSDGLRKLDAHPMSLFQARLATRTVDLRKAPHVTRRESWVHPDDYTATQAFARDAREAGIGAIMYESVRDPARGACVAVLSPDAFEDGQAPVPETWYLTVTAKGATWQRDRDEAFVFEWDR